jgi:hypothetical protein
MTTRKIEVRLPVDAIERLDKEAAWCRLCVVGLGLVLIPGKLSRPSPL